MFGFRSYPTPIFRPLWPFMAGAGIVFFGISALQTSMLQSDEFKNDPRNPHAKKKPAADH